jgi:subtilisin family serine protease
MHFLRWFAAVALTGLLGLAACQGERSPTEPVAASLTRESSGGVKQYVVIMHGDELAADIGSQIAAAGGQLTASMPKAGLVLARSEVPDFAQRAGRIAGVQGVTEDRLEQWVPPNIRVEELGNGAVPLLGGRAIGSSETFFAFQWAPRAIHAPEAWQTGALGNGVRIAVVDGGIYDKHIDIAPNLDVAHSVSFALDADGNPTTFNQDVGTFWHATHVAGIAAAPAQGIGTVGIAPGATIIGVKALHDGSGSFGALIQAIYYAATPIAEGGAGADIVNLSLGIPPTRLRGTDHLLAVALSKATTYAYWRGVTIFAAAGNDATDLDHVASALVIPAQSAHVIAIGATGPVDFEHLGDAAGVDRPAAYSNFGQSVISFAAPGGDFTLFDRGQWFLDMVLSPCRGAGASIETYCFAAGTSMATPAAAGVAALIIGKFGRIGPAQVEARIRSSADDVGKPGNDDFYGNGRVNALRAVQ